MHPIHTHLIKHATSLPFDDSQDLGRNVFNDLSSVGLVVIAATIVIFVVVVLVVSSPLRLSCLRLSDETRYDMFSGVSS